MRIRPSSDWPFFWHRMVITHGLGKTKEDAYSVSHLESKSIRTASEAPQERRGCENSVLHAPTKPISCNWWITVVDIRYGRALSAFVSNVNKWGLDRVLHFVTPNGVQCSVYCRTMDDMCLVIQGSHVSEPAPGLHQCVVRLRPICGYAGPCMVHDPMKARRAIS